MRIHCGGLLDSIFLSTYGDGAITGSFFEDLVFLHALHLVFAKHELIFVLVKGITTVMVLKHLLYAHVLTLSCGCCMGTGETITSRASLIHGFVVFFSLKKPFAMLDLRLSGYIIHYFLFYKEIYKKFCKLSM